MDLVRAWQARRALDYLVGYGLSPLLWRKLPGLPLGRAGPVGGAQARCATARPRSRPSRRGDYRTVHAALAAADGVAFAATLVRLDGEEIGEAGLATARAAEEAAARIRGRRGSRSGRSSATRCRRRPLPPFTTATLQQEAARRLGFGIGETMDIAQRLYEGVDLGGETAGLITYMRTDSTAMAKTAVAQARAVARKRFGDACVPAKPRVHRSRDRQGGTREHGETPRLAQEAHEAIRPTDFARSPDRLAGRLDRAAVQLYGLIWNRALASQMAAARFDRLRVEIAPEGTEGIGLAAGGERMVFDGHLRVWGGDGAPDIEEESGLPAVAEGEPVTPAAVRVERHATEPPPRYTEAGLVRRLLSTAAMAACIEIAAPLHPAWERCSPAVRKLHARNAAVLGLTLDRPVDAVVAFTSEGRVKGGTGMANRIAEANDIPVLNLGSMTPRAVCECLAAIRRSASAS